MSAETKHTKELIIRDGEYNIRLTDYNEVVRRAQVEIAEQQDSFEASQSRAAERICTLETQLAENNAIIEYMEEEKAGREKVYVKDYQTYLALKAQNNELREAGMELYSAYVEQIESEYSGTSFVDNLMRVADKYKALSGG